MSDIKDRLQALEDTTESLKNRIGELEEKIKSNSLQAQTSLEKFVEEVNPETHQQCALAIAYQIDILNGNEFTMDDISEGFKEARWKDYSNMRMLKRQLLKKGWIRDADREEDEIYMVTKEGKQFIEAQIEG